MSSDSKVPSAKYLLNCPCCGGSEIFESKIDPDEKSYDFVICNGCGLSVARADSGREPSDVWNMRVGIDLSAGSELFEIINQIKNISEIAHLSIDGVSAIQKLHASASKLFPSISNDGRQSATTATSTVKKDTCGLCGELWSEHDFGVPAPDCPSPPFSFSHDEVVNIAPEASKMIRNNDSGDDNISTLIESMQRSGAESHRMFKAIVAYGHELAIYEDESAFLHQLSTQTSTPLGTAGNCAQCQSNKDQAAVLISRRSEVKHMMASSKEIGNE